MTISHSKQSSAQDPAKFGHDGDSRDEQTDVQEKIAGHRLAGGASEADVLVPELLLHRLGHLSGLALGGLDGLGLLRHCGVDIAGIVDRAG